MKHDRLTPAQEAEPVRNPTRAALVQTAPEADAAPATPKRRRLVLPVIAALALAGGGYAGFEYWTVGRFMESTDDAYVQTDITMIASRVQGYVTELPVAANAHVKAGDVLIRLDDGDFRVALETAQSRLASSAETLARIDAQIVAAKAAVTQAEAGQQAAEAQLRSAESSFTRVKDLHDRDVATQASLDTATEGQDTARANLASARASVASAEAQVQVLKAQRAEAEGTRRQMELAVEQARRDLDKTVLRAPADGTLANLALERGDLVAPGSQLAALVPDGAYYIEANFKETQMPGVGPGAHVTLSFDALPGQEFEGTVESAAPATGSVFSLLPADNATGNFTKVVQRVPVRIAIPEDAMATGQLRAGLSVEVEVDSRTGTTAHRLASAE